MTSRNQSGGRDSAGRSIAGPAFAQAPGADIYKAKCAMCHGADGLAATPMAKSMKILSFKDPAMVKATDAQLIASTTNGKGKMPAYRQTDRRADQGCGCVHSHAAEVAARASKPGHMA